MSGWRRRLDAGDGSASLALPMVLWVATLVGIAVIDIGAYLVAAARAQTLADGAALAAVSADAPDVRGQIPSAQAERVAHAGNGRLVACGCVAGRERATVTVSVPVPGLVLPTLGASRVAAEASAVLAPPDDLLPGPTRERAGWPRPLDP